MINISRATMRDAIRAIFIKRFSEQPLLIHAPGRINLIGEHTDYNKGFVLPAAIDKGIFFAIAANGEPSKCRLFAADLDEYYEFDLHNYKAMPSGWQNYLMGVVNEIQKMGYEPKGFDAVFGGNIPKGAGLSSSAALENGLAFGLNEIFQLEIETFRLIQLSQLAEHNFVGVKCGIMDQFASMMGKKDHVIRLDCRSMDFQYVPLDLKNYSLVLCDSDVSHDLADSEYNTRREECERGLAVFRESDPNIHSLRDVDLETLLGHQMLMPNVIYRRCRYVVAENNRVLEVCKALEKGNLDRVGELLYQGHEGLQHDYEVSCKELDFLVDWTRKKDAVLGARMMGGGFGGCTINLIHQDFIDDFMEQLAVDFYEKFDKYLKTYQVHPSDGVRII
jgi:galactokinase